MASHSAAARKDTSSRLQRDITWGRLLFLPPELANPRIIFEPLPFRDHQFPAFRGKKTPLAH